MARPSKKAHAREVLVEAGKKALLKEGLQVGIDHLSLEDVLRETVVPRSSAYAAWAEVDSGTPQVAFRRAVLKRLIEEPFDLHEIDATYDLLAKVDLSTVEQSSAARRAALRQLVRIGGKAHIESLCQSKNWWVTTVVQGATAAMDEDDRDQELLAALRDAESAWREVVTEKLYKPFMSMLGFRPKTSIKGTADWTPFVLAAAALAEGMAAHYLLNRAAMDGILVSSEGNDDEEWTLFALALWALVEEFLEPVDTGSHQTMVGTVDN